MKFQIETNKPIPKGRYRRSELSQSVACMAVGDSIKLETFSQLSNAIAAGKRLGFEMTSSARGEFRVWRVA